MAVDIAAVVVADDTGAVAAVVDDSVAVVVFVDYNPDIAWRYDIIYLIKYFEYHIKDKLQKIDQIQLKIKTAKQSPITHFPAETMKEINIK